MIIYTIHRKH